MSDKGERFVKDFILCLDVDTGVLHLRRRAKEGRRQKRTYRSMFRQWLCAARGVSLDTEDDFDPRRHQAELCHQCRTEYEAAARQFHGLPASGRLVF